MMKSETVHGLTYSILLIVCHRSIQGTVRHRVITQIHMRHHRFLMLREIYIETYQSETSSYPHNAVIDVHRLNIIFSEWSQPHCQIVRHSVHHQSHSIVVTMPMFALVIGIFEQLRQYTFLLTYEMLFSCWFIIMFTSKCQCPDISLVVFLHLDDIGYAV